jgi:hypothetical protein
MRMSSNAVRASVLLLVAVLGGGSVAAQEREGGGRNLRSVPLGAYTVLAWNDLGMHCLNPTYDTLVILPPYNNLVVQVVKRGSPPRVVASGVTVSYSLEGNTTSANKRSFGVFWANAVKLFGGLFGITGLPADTGLKGKRLAGTMDAAGDRFVAEGIPVVPYDDRGTWNPYQVAVITVKDSSGAVVATTRATMPTSDEINCAKCHGANAFPDILARHDRANHTSLASSTPVLCAGCHASPALGQASRIGSIPFLSESIHGFHAQVGAACYDCHPGVRTQCSRSLAHTAADGNCTSCHGDMTKVSSSITSRGRIPWVSEPACASCHTGVAGVDTGAALYRNSTGHGGVACAACHGSPHAMVPTRQASDNYQVLQYQGYSGAVKALGSCGVCHQSSRGAGIGGEFMETHGTPGAVPNGCSACHTSIPSNAKAWPHGYTWKNSNL